MIDAQLEHVVRGRLLQRLVQGGDVTVMLFPEIDETEEWLEAMTTRRAGHDEGGNPPTTALPRS